jgi:two-component system, NtrC family, response regulator HydG
MSENILVIDDEENIRFTFSKFLEDAGYAVKTAQGFDEALAMTAGNAFDMIFADIVLGGRTGIDVLRALKQQGITCPLIFITGYPDIDTVSDALRLGAFDYIHKPVEKDAILRAAKMALQHKALLDKIEQNRRNLEAIFRSVVDAIITVDRDLTIVEVNDATRKILGFNREVIGKPFSALPMSCCKSCLEALENTINNKSSVELYRIECRVKDCGSKLVVTVNTSPLLDHEGKCLGAVMVLKNETRTAELEHDLQARQRYHQLVGRSREMQRVYAMIDSVCDVPSTVLITGASGTGKELVAEALHSNGIRRDKPFVKVNLPAISEQLFESEFFGHVKGAFTGADSDRKGRFQLADGGTLFLDEIGDIPQRIQLSLLRVLQESSFERVGDATPITVDVRIIAATNQNLLDKIKRGRFREDLYYRLKIVEIALPELKERKEDIPLLVDHFIEKFNKILHKSISAVSDDVLDVLTTFSWPGNVRQLEHTLESACIFCQQGIITMDHLPADFRQAIYGNGHGRLEDDGVSERRQILHALENTDWNKAKAARILGMGRRTLYRKIDEHDITDPLR